MLSQTPVSPIAQADRTMAHRTLSHISHRTPHASEATARPYHFIISLALSGLLAVSTEAYGIDDSTYYEYLKKSWDIINYNSNMQQTGKGIEVVVVDGPFNTNHPSLKDQVIETYRNQFDFDKTERADRLAADQHGSHVAGIIVGKKLDAYGKTYPHGIAHEGKFYGVAALNWGTWNGIWEILRDKDVKIINNSWGPIDHFPLINRTMDSGYQVLDKTSDTFSPISVDRYFSILNQYYNPLQNMRDLIRLTQEKGALNIVASGNEGSVSSGFIGAAAAYDESLRAWLVVGALYAPMIDNQNNKLTIKTEVLQDEGNRWKDWYASGIPLYSNLFKGNALYGIMAPGEGIDSANAFFENDNIYKWVKTPDGKMEAVSVKQETWVNMGGTSMATPMVSGAAMLVQEKFGFLNGAQIADVLLSTANFDNVVLPRMFVKTGNDALFGIVYTDKAAYEKVVKDGKIDTNKLQEDLQQLGYTHDKAKEIATQLYNINGGKHDTNAVIYLEKHEIIGQGILDVKKALGGLARLDANRLNTQDVMKFENENQAFYTINTQGKDGTFSNSIEQREWNDKWHIKGALNSPEAVMKNITKVGLIKTGAGTLTLSGTTNTYKGATRVVGGTLEIAKDSTLTESNAYAESYGARLHLKGTISKDLTARNGGVAELSGTAKVGQNATAESGGMVQIVDSGTIGQSITAKDSGVIQLGKVEGGANKQGTLATGSVKLESGGILAGAGTISRGSDTNSSTTQVENTSGVVMAGFGAEKITNLTESNTLTISGTYTQKADSTLQIAFNGQKNSNLKADSYNITGGSILEFVPTYANDGTGNRLQANQTIPINLENGLNNQASNFTIKAQSSNSLTFQYDKDKHHLYSTIKPDAFTPSDSANAGVGEALKDIFLRTDLDSSYNDYFGKLDVSSKELYTQSINSHAENAPLESIEDSFISQSSLSLASLAYTLDPTMSVSTLSRIRERDIHKKLATLRLASVRSDSDVMISNALSKLTAIKPNQMILNTGYTHLRRSSHAAHTFNTNLQYKRILGEKALLGAYLDYGYTNASHTYTKRSSNVLSVGMSGIYDFSYISLLANASVGMGLHHTDRQFITANNAGAASMSQTLSGDYTSYLWGVQLGVGKDFSLPAHFTLKPMALLNYNGIAQGAYREQGAIFAKSVGSATYNMLGSSLGLMASYALEQRELHYTLSAFGFYNARFFTTMQSVSGFADFSDTSFTQSIKLYPHSFYGGISGQLRYKDYFARLSLASEASRDYYWLNANLSLGMEF